MIFTQTNFIVTAFFILFDLQFYFMFILLENFDEISIPESCSLRKISRVARISATQLFKQFALEFQYVHKAMWFRLLCWMIFILKVTIFTDCFELKRWFKVIEDLEVSKPASLWYSNYFNEVKCLMVRNHKRQHDEMIHNFTISWFRFFKVHRSLKLFSYKHS